MAETKFIKAAASCGYDKADVDKRLDFLYNLVYDLKNELRESKLLLQQYQSGSDTEKSFETVLASERAQITQVQVKNENLSERNNAIKEEARLKEVENAELRETIRDLQAKLADSELTVRSLQGGGSHEVLGTIFVEAQKSRDMILSEADEKAKAREENSRKFAEDFITDANNQASKIIYDAERKAAEIIADAENHSEQVMVSANNLRAVMYSELRSLSTTAAELRKMVLHFTDVNLSTVAGITDILDRTEQTLNNGGIPIFVQPHEIKPEYPPEPVYIKPEPAPDEKTSSELDKLQAMAEAIGGMESIAEQPETPDNKKVSDASVQSSGDSGAKKGGLNLDDLMRQASALES